MQRYAILLSLVLLICWTAHPVAAGPCSDSLGCGGSPIFAAGNQCIQCTVYACQAARDVDDAYYRQLNTECSITGAVAECAEDAYMQMLVACADVDSAKDDCEAAWCSAGGSTV